MVYWKISDTSMILSTTRIAFTGIHILLLARYGQVSHINFLKMCVRSVSGDQFFISSLFQYCASRALLVLGVRRKIGAEVEQAAEVQSRSFMHFQSFESINSAKA
jgi:hypothetical protein